MFKRFYPRTPDPFLGNNQDATIAKLGHINALIDYINDVPPGSGIQSIVAGTNVTVDNTDPLNPIVNAVSTLQNVVDQGGLTNSSTIREGTIDHGYGGGISRLCANNKDDQWEDGVRYLIETVGENKTVVYAESINNVIPDSSYDETLSYAVGSRFKNLVTGIEYLCTQATEGGALWLPLQGNTFDSIITALDVDGVSIVSGQFANLTYVINGNIATVFLQVNLNFGFFASTGNGWFRPIAIPGTTVGVSGIIGIGNLSINPENSRIFSILIHENKAYVEPELAGSGNINVPATITYSYQLSNR